MKSEKCGKILFIIIIGLLIPLHSIGAESPSEDDQRVDFGVYIQDYKWAEYADDGNKLLEETGNLYGVACDFESTKNIVGWRNGINFFIGQVDYDGRTWTDMPVKTDVLYVGTKLYFDVVPGYRLDSGLWLKSFAGIGGEFWLRDLDDTKTSNGDPVMGAREWWGCVYGRLGLGAEYPVAEEMAVFAEAGVKLPIYTRNEANFFVSGSPSAGLEPAQVVSGFGDIGFRWKQWGAKVSYDSLRFDRSDVVSSGMFDLYQPRSESDVYSVEIFWSSGF
ncbi:MAG: hypothetical protein HF978_15715 [Desulfobacteraceae bacterium]|nr:hypothetical protein [Desulfobacteraceae bacterium]MBC2756990.1 hypothetical protein [Desulfobacteraceae bacterium]